MNIRTQAVGVTAEERLLEFIDKKIGKLAGLGSPIQTAEVTLRKEHDAAIRNKVTEVVLSLPGARLYTRQSGRSFEAALERSVDTLRSQLTRYKGKSLSVRRRRSSAAG